MSYESEWIQSMEDLLKSEDPEDRDYARRSLAAHRCTECKGVGLVPGPWLVDPDDPRHSKPPLCKCQTELSQ